MSKIKVLLTQANYSRFDKRTWNFYPLALGIINACIKDSFDTVLLDPNSKNMNDQEIIQAIREINPDVVGITTASTEYLEHIEHMTHLIKKALPDVIIVEGGVLPTVLIDRAVKDKHVDFWIIGEGERNFPKLLYELEKNKPDFSNIPGLVYRKNKKIQINKASGYIKDLDSIPIADYGNLDIMDYGGHQLKYGGMDCARHLPYAMTVTSRGCPFRCVFCSSSKISGKKVRMRSAENVLREVDELYKKGIREIIFLDDHFLGDRKRAIDIMKGLIDRNYDLIWKCVNVVAWILDDELLDLMKESGCYQITISIESGNQNVLNNIIKKPIKLDKMVEIIEKIKKRGFEILGNFIIGFPDEAWDQIRDTCAFAEMIDIDYVIFHIATPLPKTELMDICIKKGLFPKDYDGCVGYTRGVISTDEFSSLDLQILRTYEWDRINFCTEEKRKMIAKIQGITVKELQEWRKNTRKKLGVIDKELVFNHR